MAQAQLHAVVRHLRRLANTSTARDMTDGQLLQRFAGRHEEDAFAALVERHGRLVWSACWQVLHHQQDVEDAFQATFLVLARQAGSIRNGQTLASWLYRVAQRTAIKARLAQSRRNAHERQAATMPHDKPASDLAWRELQAVLNKELERLPEKYRSPFLLCCLEGKSKAEAARELGWKEGTVSGRLAMARKYLQQRLARRGIALSAVLCALALAPETAKAALPRAFLEATVRAALLFTGRNGVAGLVSAHVLGLSKETLKALAVTKMKSACLWLLAVSLVVGGAGLLTHRAMAEKSTDPTAAPPSKEAAAAPQAKAMEMRGPNAAPAGIGKTKSLQEPAPKDQVVVVGQVLDPDDKPAAAAQVAVVASLRMSDDGSSFTWGGLLPEAEVLGLGRTDDAGRYRVHVPKAMFQRAYAVDVIAGKTGFGLAVEPLKTNPKMRGPDVLGEGRVAAPAQSVKENAKPVDTIVRLAREEVLTGRLIDLEGLPVAGVKVSVVRLGKLSYPANRQYTINADTIAPALIYYQDYNFREKMPRKPVPKEEKEQHAVQFSEPPRGLPLWPQGVVTDAEGRFTLRGLGRGQALGVQVRDERYAAQNLDIQPPAAGTANEVSLALGSPRLLEGAVTDAGTGKPVPHAHIHIDTFLDYFGGFGVVGDPADEKGRRYGGSAYVSMGPQITRSDCQADEQGHFRINPFVGETQVITITAPAGQPYLAVKKTLTWPKGAVRHELNVALPRGVLVRGKVEEAGKPIARSRVDFWCKEVKPSSAFGEASQHRVMYETSAHTASDGSFHAILPSGKWHVLANGPGENYLRQKLPAESITTIDPKNPNGSPGQKVGDKHFFRPDGLAVVDARLGQDTPEVKIVLHRSVLQGRLLGPDGKPVARARMYYRRRNLDWRVPPSEVTGGQFKLPLQDLDTTYSILFLDSENGIGAAVDLSGKQASGQPVTITLAPCGSARVRFVDAGGKPLVNYRPLVWAVVKPYPVLQPHDMQWIKDGHFRSDGSVWLGHADRQHYGKGPMTGADGFVTLPNLIPGGSYRISQFDGMAVDFTVEAGKTRTLADVVIKEPNKPVNLPK